MAKNTVSVEIKRIPIDVEIKDLGYVEVVDLASKVEREMMRLQEEPAGQDIVGPPLFLRGGLLLVLNACPERMRPAGAGRLPAALLLSMRFFIKNRRGYPQGHLGEEAPPPYRTSVKKVVRRSRRRSFLQWILFERTVPSSVQTLK